MRRFTVSMIRRLAIAFVLFERAVAFTVITNHQLVDPRRNNHGAHAMIMRPFVLRQADTDDSADDFSVIPDYDYNEFTIKDEWTLANSNDSQSVLNYADTIDTLPFVDDFLTSQATGDAVSVVLGVSEEAVAAAEASLSKDDRTIESTRGSKILSSTSDIPIPSVGTILKFAIPAIGVWLCGPLLSLIDTSAVGILSGTTQQAALNPAVAVTDYAALLIAFLYTGTTNLIAAAREKDREMVGSPKTASNMIGSLQLSTYVGAGLGTVLFIFARQLISAIIGNDAIDPAIYAAALRYVRIRALGMPAAAVIGSAQAACLGMQDIRSPLYILGAAAAINFMGDCLFVGSNNAMVGGAAGAAWATVFSQYAAVFLFLRWLCSSKSLSQETGVVNVSTAVIELTGNSKSKQGRKRLARVREAVQQLRLTSRATPQNCQQTESESANYFSVRGFLHAKFRARDLLRFPDQDTVKNFKPYMLPVTSTQVGRVSGYVTMSHVISSSMGYVSMAAQQVIVSLFYCLCPVADSLSLTAQSFIPAIFERPGSKQRTRALRETIINFLKAGGIFSCVMIAAVSCIPILSGIFTSDPAVVALVNMVAPFLMGFFAVHGFVCAGEGLLLGQKDLSFLGNLYTMFFAVVPYFMMRVKRAALSAVRPIDLTSVWSVFLCYQLFRFITWTARVWMLQRKTEKSTATLGA